jgi:hypothetical protein
MKEERAVVIGICRVCIVVIDWPCPGAHVTDL